MKVLFPDGYVVRLDSSGRRYAVLSTKDIRFRNCITPGCLRTFRRAFYPPCRGGEKEHHSSQCDNFHRAIKRRKSA